MYIKQVFSDQPTNPTVSDSLLSGLLLYGRLDFNGEIMEFQLFLFSFVLESVFHGDEVSSLNKLEGAVFAQGHSFIKATYRRKYLKRRIIYMVVLDH